MEEQNVALEFVLDGLREALGHESIIDTIHIVMSATARIKRLEAKIRLLQGEKDHATL